MNSQCELSSFGILGMSKRYNSCTKKVNTNPFYETQRLKFFHQLAKDGDADRKSEINSSSQAEKESYLQTKKELDSTTDGQPTPSSVHNLPFNAKYNSKVGLDSCEVKGFSLPRTFCPNVIEEDKTEHSQVNNASQWYLNRTTTSIILLQVCYALVLTALVRYSDEAHAGEMKNSIRPMRGGNAHETLPHEIRELLQISLYITICLYLRLVFVKGWNGTTTVAFFLIACMSLEWSVLCRGLMESSANGKAIVNIKGVIDAELTCLSVLVSVSIMSGNASLLQMIAMQLLHVPLQLLLDRIMKTYLSVSDFGNTLSSHAFGAFYGLFVTLAMVKTKPSTKTSLKCKAFPEIFFSLGTFLLMIYWLSIPCTITSGDAQRRAVLNTVLALLSSSVVAFPVVSASSPTRKFTLETIQDGIVSAGVATASVSPLMLEMYGAVILGGLTSAICILFKNLIKPKLSTHFKLKESFGIFVSHGIGGFIGGVIAAIMSSVASPELGYYGYSLYKLYPARTPPENSLDLWDVQSYLPIPAGQGRSAIGQAGYQLLGLLIAIVLASVGGCLTGLLLRLRVFDEYEEKYDYVSCDENQHHCGVPTCRRDNIHELFYRILSYYESKGFICNKSVINCKENLTDNKSTNVPENV